MLVPLVTQAIAPNAGGGGGVSHGNVQTRRPRNRRQCKFFVQGRCFKGGACPYSHDNMAMPPSSPPVTQSYATTRQPRRAGGQMQGRPQQNRTSVPQHGGFNPRSRRQSQQQGRRMQQPYSMAPVQQRGTRQQQGMMSMPQASVG